MSRLVLLRHGRTDWNDSGRAQGHAAVLSGDIGSNPGRETRDDVPVRCVRALTSYAESLAPDETGIVVSHGAALRVAVPAFLGWNRVA